MAHKTNKTAHVLKLISKSKEEHNLDDDLEIEPNESGITNDLSFIDMDIQNDNEVSEKVRENLSAIVDDNIDENVTDTIENNTLNSGIQATQYNNDTDVNVSSEESDNGPETVISEALAEDVSVQPVSDKEIIQTTVNTPDKTSVQSAEAQSDKNLGYQYVNVLEEIVKNRVDEFLKLFDVCPCQRCRSDVIALALNGLTPKYIVVDNYQVSPLLNFFSNHYSGAVTAQLSRACTVVKNNPHH